MTLMKHHKSNLELSNRNHSQVTLDLDMPRNPEELGEKKVPK